jgi:hypothetical protein
MNRQEYLESPGNNHRTYYAQYVSLHIKNIIEAYIGNDIRKFNDLNNINITVWERLVSFIPKYTFDKVKANGDNNSVNTGICILKEAARQIKDQYQKTYLNIS